MTSDRSIEEPCEVTSLTHGFEAERRGRPLRLGSELFRRLQATGLPLEAGSGGRTKYNRSVRGLPKTHWLDAACVATPVNCLNPRTKRGKADQVGTMVTLTFSWTERMPTRFQYPLRRRSPNNGRTVQTGHLHRAHLDEC
jgi:hypothetical protein